MDVIVAVYGGGGDEACIRCCIQDSGIMEGTGC